MRTLTILIIGIPGVVVAIVIGVVIGSQELTVTESGTTMRCGTVFDRDTEENILRLPQSVDLDTQLKLVDACEKKASWREPIADGLIAGGVTGGVSLVIITLVRVIRRRGRKEVPE